MSCGVDMGWLSVGRLSWFCVSVFAFWYVEFESTGYLELSKRCSDISCESSEYLVNKTLRIIMKHEAQEKKGERGRREHRIQPSQCRSVSSGTVPYWAFGLFYRPSRFPARASVDAERNALENHRENSSEPELPRSVGIAPERNICCPGSKGLWFPCSFSVMLL